MADQVAALNDEPTHFQIGEPDAPCGGSSTCTDCCGAIIVFHETGQRISARQFRQKAAPDKDPCRGLNPSQLVTGLLGFGVHGYAVHVNATAGDAIGATDNGIVLVCIGYGGFPSPAECEVGGRTDVNFTGPHAITLWGRRRWTVKPKDWPAGKTFRPGWRNWTRDPDHHYGDIRPRYDRFRSGFLVRAMDALVGNEGWNVRCAIYRSHPPGAIRPKIAGLEPHTAEVATTWTLDQLPDLGAGQTGGPHA